MRLEWAPSERGGVEAHCGGYTLHVMENPSVADMLAGRPEMYEWRIFRHTWAVPVGGREAGERNTLPTMGAAQDAAEADVARLLAEDEGVLALLGLSGTFDDFPILRTGGREFVPVGHARVERARAEAAEARASELDYRRQMVAECAYVVEQERDALRARVAELERRNASLAALLAQAEADNRAWAEKERWIPVGERLPEDGQWVVVWFGAGADVSTRRNDAWTLGGADDVTHWRPLPAGPEAK